MPYNIWFPVKLSKTTFTVPFLVNSRLNANKNTLWFILWISGLLISPSWSTCQSVIQIKVHASINILVQRVRPFCSLMLGSFWGTETYIKSCCVGCRISMDFFNNSKIILPVFAVRFSHLKVLHTRICASKHFFQELDLAFWPHLVIKQWRCDQINSLFVRICNQMLLFQQSHPRLQKNNLLPPLPDQEERMGLVQAANTELGCVFAARRRLVCCLNPLKSLLIKPCLPISHYSIIKKLFVSTLGFWNDVLKNLFVPFVVFGTGFFRTWNHWNTRKGCWVLLFYPYSVFFHKTGIVGAVRQHHWKCMVLSSKSELLWLFGTWKYWLGRWPESLSAVISVLALIFSDFWPSVVWPLHIFLFLFFCVSLVPMAAVSETSDASAWDSIRIFLDSDCSVWTVFLGSQYKLSAQFLYLNKTTSWAIDPFVKPLYLKLMRLLVVFYFWVNFVFVKRSPVNNFTCQYLTYLIECFVSSCVFPCILINTLALCFRSCFTQLLSTSITPLRRIIT